jgi:hypothetical protein
MMAAVMALTMAGIADENPDLKQVAIALGPALQKLDLKADITYPSGTTSLVVSYRTQLYKIHGRSMTGEISPDAHDETGPSFKGFVLRVHLQDKGEVNQACTPQTLQEPYWQTYLDVTPIGATEKQIYWALSFGSRTDTKLLAQLRKALNDLKAEQAGADQPATKPADKPPVKSQTSTPTSKDGPR